ncbi:hypothetical protein O3Q51_16080 [Cryomorphaceae bacterium 1068]|nr:hypothetical protein [Cryomorphaceae bacterium 1068]
MKQLLSLFLILFASLCFGQTEPKDGRNGLNEVKFNIGSAIFELFEFSYERVLNNDMGIGLSANFLTEEGVNYRGAILPHFRFYPSERLIASGFFLEANTGVIFSENDNTIFIDDNGNATYSDESYVSFGLGIAVGGKFVSKTGIFGEIYGGIGREFLDESFIEVYPRVGLNFGYRF